MECMLLPKSSTVPLARVQYVDNVKYDGGEWFSYPRRRDNRWPCFGLDDTLPLYQYMNSLPNSRGLEPWLQTWLFFGLILEVFGGNAPEDSDSVPGPNNEGAYAVNQYEVVKRIYEGYTFQDGDHQYLTTATFLQDLETHVRLTMVDRILFKSSCVRLSQCLRMAWGVLSTVPKDFDPVIRASIGVVGEILSHSMNYAFTLYKIPIYCPVKWATTYFDQVPLRRDGQPSVRATMLSKGWCPSDISRSMNKFSSLQLFHFLGTMDRSIPYRDHSQCNDVNCAAYQINKSYKVRHVHPECGCRLISADNSAVVSILEKENAIPLLKFVGGIDDLKIEIVQSSKDTPYVAISHVWADGLGNPKENALNSCELIRLRTLVEELRFQDSSTKDPFTAGHDNEALFIWIDTLCCPIESEAKKMALEKIRHVYEYARHVLVLDGSLEVYKAHEMDLIEQLARIFTSGWLRRLWTLQEGALAESLYFQFADCAISLDLPKLLLVQNRRDLRYRILALDFLPEFFRLQYFYHSDRLGDEAKILRSHSALSLANTALQYRSVSVASDEPLCLACILSVSTKPMLEKNVVEHDRMQILWRLIAEKEGGIPASIIFFEDTRIDSPGWRWAPASLLTIKPQMLSFETRILRWSDKNLGWPTPNGLKVKLPGYRIIQRKATDGKPRHPWKGLPRLPEGQICCRDVDTGKWYHIIDKGFAMMSGTWTDEALQAHNALNKFPINDLISNGECFIVQGKESTEGILASLVPPEEIVISTEPLQSTPIKTRHHIIFKEASPAQAIFHNIIESFAQELRKDKLTDKLLALESQKEAEISEEYDAIIKALKEKMKEMMRAAIQQYSELGPAIDSQWGNTRRDHVWVCIGDWYYNDFQMSKMPADQVWYVD